jgi:hypothetical protein
MSNQRFLPNAVHRVTLQLHSNHLLAARLPQAGHCYLMGGRSLLEGARGLLRRQGLQQVHLTPLAQQWQRHHHQQQQQGDISGRA